MSREAMRVCNKVLAASCAVSFEEEAEEDGKLEAEEDEPPPRPLLPCLLRLAADLCDPFVVDLGEAEEEPAAAASEEEEEEEEAAADGSCHFAETG